MIYDISDMIYMIYDTIYLLTAIG